MAKVVGLDKSSLVRIELGRAPLKYETARAILQFLNANPVWIATGRGPKKPTVPLPDAPSLGISDNTPFSRVFNDHLKGYLAPSTSDAAEEDPKRVSASAEVRLAAIDVIAARAKHWLRSVPEANLVEFIQSTIQFGDALLQKCKPDVWQAELMRHAQMDVLETATGSKNNPLTELGDTLKSASVKQKSLWNDLRGRLNATLTQFGAKAALAREFNVTPASVSEWLSGDSSPTAETTLRLLQWVTEAESKQRSPGRAQTRPEPKDPTQPINHEKAKSGPKKR